MRLGLLHDLVTPEYTHFCEDDLADAALRVGALSETALKLA